MERTARFAGLDAPVSMSIDISEPQQVNRVERIKAVIARLAKPSTELPVEQPIEPIQNSSPRGEEFTGRGAEPIQKTPQETAVDGR
jgi:hypothetical protein